MTNERVQVLPVPQRIPGVGMRECRCLESERAVLVRTLQVGFAGEYVPRKIVPKNMLKRTAGARNPTRRPSHEVSEPEKVEEALRNVFIDILLCTPRGRKVVLCEKVTEQTKFRALVVRYELQMTMEESW